MASSIVCTHSELVKQVEVVMTLRELYPPIAYAKNAKTAGPCVRNCCLDADDVCLGCGRALAEITGWNAASDEEKEAILRRAKERLAMKNHSLPF